MAKEVEAVPVDESPFEAIQPSSITWQNINVFSSSETSMLGISQPRPSVQIIKNVSGEVKAGSNVAIMGSSGAGKTTLLNVLTARNLSNFIVDGVVKINNQIADVDMITSISAYVQQDDLFIPKLSVREHLIFQSMVRMDPALSDEEKEKRIVYLMRELSLEKCADTWVGGTNSFKGISGGEMKRLSFAVEILTNPSLLFCDEPTSGLDAFMACQLVTYIQKMSKAGRTVICTIHQPSSEVFALFKYLLLLADGRTAYMGEVSKAVGYFNRIGMKCPMNYNPADYFIQQMAVVPGKDFECKRKIHRVCDWYEKLAPPVADTRRQSSFIKKKPTYSRYKATALQQYQALTWRAYLSTCREPMLTYIRTFQAFIISIVLGLFFWQQDYDQRGGLNINGALYLLIINITIQNSFAVVNVFCSELPIFLREHNSGMYRVDAYFMARNLAEIPIFVVIPFIVVLVYYYMVGLFPSFDCFLFCMMVSFLISFCGVAFGYFTSCVCNNTDLALSLGPPLLVPLQLLGGFYLNTKTIPHYLTWAQFLSWFHYGFDLLVVNQWRNVGHLDCMNISNVAANDTDLSSHMCIATGKAMIRYLYLGEKPVWVNFFGLFMLGFWMRLNGYISLVVRSYSR